MSGFSSLLCCTASASYYAKYMVNGQYLLGWQILGSDWHEKMTYGKHPSVFAYMKKLKVTLKTSSVSTSFEIKFICCYLISITAKFTCNVHF